MKAAPLRCVAGPVPESTSPRTITQRIGTRSGCSAARRIARVGSAVGASRPCSSSPWVNSNGASRSDCRIGRRSSSARRVRSQAVAAGASRARADDVPEQDDRVHAGRLTDPRLAVND